MLMAGTRGYLDPVPVVDVRRFETELLEWFRSRHGDVLGTIRSTGTLGDEEAVEAAIAAFADQFRVSAGTPGEPDAEAQGDANSRVVDASNILPEEEISRAQS